MLRHSLLVGYHIEHKGDKIHHVYHQLLVLVGEGEAGVDTSAPFFDHSDRPLNFTNMLSSCCSVEFD